MKSIRFFTAMAILFGLSVSAASLQAAEKRTAKDFVEKELLIKFKLGENEKGNAEIRKIGAEVLEKLSQIDISRLSVPKGMSVEKAVEKLSKLDFVEFAEPNYIQRITGGPNDPKYKEQWGLETIRALKGWGVHTGRSKTIIAIVDTGVDLTHPDLKNKIISGYNFVEDNNKPEDDEGHGTHCAGIAAASAGNSEGIAGVCPNCSIMPVRGLGVDGQGSVTTVSNGIIYAADHGAHVISMSFGSAAYSTTLKDAIEYAAKKGVVLVAAAGNDGVETPFYPAYLEQCIAVGSTDKQDDKRSYFSNYGDWVDVAAPGSEILSTVPGGYDYKQGTSMAAPFVSGLAALMVSCSGASTDKVRKAILSSAKPVGDWVASGRIDVPNALAAVGCGGTTNSGKTPSSNSSTGKTPANDSSAGKTPANGAVTAYKIQNGRMLKEPKDAMAASDDERLGVGSKGAGLANFLDLNMTAKLQSSVTYTALKVEIESFAENPGNFEVHLMNASGTWVKVGTVRLEMKEGKVAVEVPNSAGYVSKTGEVQIRLYRTEKLWNGFEIGIDWVQVTGVEKAAAPEKKDPEGNGKSTGSKAKDAWESLKKKF